MEVAQLEIPHGVEGAKQVGVCDGTHRLTTRIPDPLYIQLANILREKYIPKNGA